MLKSYALGSGGVNNKVCVPISLRMLKSYALGSEGVNDKVCVPISSPFSISKLGYCVAPLAAITRIALICHGQGYPFFQV